MRMALLAAALLAVTGAAAVGPAPAHAAACTGYGGLTFDDGPSNGNTPALLYALRQNGLRATMFNEGQYAAAYPAQVRAEQSAGMWIGNHSYTHPHLVQMSQSQIDSELSRTQVIWDVDSQDWNGASVDAIVAANARLTNGQVILMHEWPANTLSAIPRIAQGLAGRGLCAGMISPQTGRAVAPR